MKLWNGLVSFSVLLGLGCVSAPTTPGSPTEVVEYFVAPPDVLFIRIRPEPSIERSVTIRPDGHISLELIGDVLVEGKTVEEIRQEITERIGAFILRPEVTVDLEQSNSRRFYVLGQVRRPGVFPLVGNVTAIEALGQAGDSTFLASLNSSHLTRGTGEGAKNFRLRFDDIRERGDLTTNYELKPGDVIYVPPTALARVGFVIHSILFPFFPILGGARTAESF